MSQPLQTLGYSPGMDNIINYSHRYSTVRDCYSPFGTLLTLDAQPPNGANPHQKV